MNHLILIYNIDLQYIIRDQVRYLKLGDTLFRFFREKSFKLGFTFVYLFYIFKLLPQLK